MTEMAKDPTTDAAVRHGAADCRGDASERATVCGYVLRLARRLAAASGAAGAAAFRFAWP